MCTAMAYRNNGLYFLRNFDYERSFSQKITAVPKNFPLHFRHQATILEHYGILGVARTEQNIPLFFDAMNEQGLCMAGLNFVGNAFYKKPITGFFNITHFELIFWVLSQCKTVREAEALLKRTSVTNTAFNEATPPAELHWLIADGTETLVAEPTVDGLKIYKNDVHVLTNNPPFSCQREALNQYYGVSSRPPVNRFAENITLKQFSRGMGALGLPGDLSSMSRFVRAAFVLGNTVSSERLETNVSASFHLLSAVEQWRGCCRLLDDSLEYTIYSAVMSTNNKTYYFKTYDGGNIGEVSFHDFPLNGERLYHYSMDIPFETKNQCAE